MDLKLGIAIGTTLLLASAQPDADLACTTYTDLSEPCGCAFTKDSFDPMCGSDGLTYLNACFMECRNAVSDAYTYIEVEYPGVCQNEFQCQCRTEYKPVCGSNNVTYSNECTLQCATAKDSSIQLKYEGTCGSHHEVSTTTERIQEERTCPDIRGICKKKKKNRGQLRTDSWEPEQEEFVRPSSENFEQPISVEEHVNNKGNREEGEDVPQRKKCMCAAVHEPICANNNKTYPNLCVLHCDSKKDSRIQFHRWGPCTV